MLYRNKTAQEISQVLTDYVVYYPERTGCSIDEGMDELKDLLKKQLEKKKQELFDDIFSTFTPASLKEALSQIGNFIPQGAATYIKD